MECAGTQYASRPGGTFPARFAAAVRAARERGAAARGRSSRVGCPHQQPADHQGQHHRRSRHRHGQHLPGRIGDGHAAAHPGSRTCSPRRRTLECARPGGRCSPRRHLHRRRRTDRTWRHHPERAGQLRSRHPAAGSHDHSAAVPLRQPGTWFLRYRERRHGSRRPCAGRGQRTCVGDHDGVRWELVDERVEQTASDRDARVQGVCDGEERPRQRTRQKQRSVLRSRHRLADRDDRWAPIAVEQPGTWLLGHGERSHPGRGARSGRHHRSGERDHDGVRREMVDERPEQRTADRETRVHGVCHREKRPRQRTRQEQRSVLRSRHGLADRDDRGAVDAVEQPAAGVLWNGERSHPGRGARAGRNHRTGERDDDGVRREMVDERPEQRTADRETRVQGVCDREKRAGQRTRQEQRSDLRSQHPAAGSLDRGTGFAVEQPAAGVLWNGERSHRRSWCTCSKEPPKWRALPRPPPAGNGRRAR